MPVAATQAERIAVEQPAGSTTDCCSCQRSTPCPPLGPSDGDDASRDRP